MIDIDPFMTDAVTRDTIPAVSPGEHYSTAAGLQWQGGSWRLGSGHVLDFQGSTLELDVDRVTDEMLRAEEPIIMIPSKINHIYGKTGEDAWAAVLTHQRVKDVKLVGNFSKLAP